MRKRHQTGNIGCIEGASDAVVSSQTGGSSTPTNTPINCLRVWAVNMTQIILLVLDIGAIAYAIWRSSVANSAIAGIINLVAISLRLVG